MVTQELNFNTCVEELIKKLKGKLFLNFLPVLSM